MDFYSRIIINLFCLVISYLSIFGLCIFKFFFKKFKTWYNIYGIIYRTIMIVVKAVFVYSFYDLMVKNNYSFSNMKNDTHNLNFMLVNIFVIEISNIIAIILRGLTITPKRLAYIFCCSALLLQSIIGYAYLPILILFGNHVCDLLKDIIYIFTKNKSYVTYIYVFIKPILLYDIIWHSVNNINYLLELFIPISVLFVSFYQWKQLQ